ncbi:type IV pilus minor pilin ComGF family protein [Limosilactobacillus kribbianus]|uniref:type IV pilus minor pilin ComGF family protein n=1 Tax=Limosilactobacillus kribbianus TaxID=2982695 RepID=UPI002264EFA5|nr:type IV pilus minor pilin ComGF family protein [Limosilactobacillus kribbianus]
MNKQAGFTIAESILALLVTALVMVLINFALFALQRINRPGLGQTADWYIFLREMESPDHHFILEEVDGQSELVVKEPSTGLKYQLQGRDTFYLTAVEHGGYLRVLDNIKGDQYSFTQLPGARVLVEVERTNGEQNTGIIQFYQK